MAKSKPAPQQIEEAAPETQPSPEERAPAAPKAFGRGWKRDVPDARDWAANALLGAPLNLPPEVSLKEHVARVNNQRGTSSCVGQAIARALHARLRKLGFDPPEFSPFGIYTPARRRAVGKDAKLGDDGCYPRDAMQSIKDIGVPREDAWPFDEAKVNDDGKWSAFQDASKFVVFRWWRVYSEGASRSAAVAQAVAKGYPVVFGLSLWAAFNAYAGGTILAPEADDAGGHMMVVVGYRTRADGKREFLVLNSWGDGWGEGGYCWLHEDVLASPRAYDFYVIQVQ